MTWASSLREGTPPVQVLATILGSDEYAIRAGATPDGFIRTLFFYLTGRPPTFVEQNLAPPRRV